MNAWRNIVLLLGVVIASCTGSKYNQFIHVNEEELNEHILLDTTFDLYVKAIGKRSVPLDVAGKRKIEIPCNYYSPDCGGEIKEMEFLFVSKEKRIAFVINNYPNRNEHFGESIEQGPHVANIRDTIDVNLWWFSQFRFGRLTTGNDTITMRTLRNHSQTHQWALHVRGDTAIEVVSISRILVDGLDRRETGKSLFLTPTFVRAEYKMFFKDPDEDAPFIPSKKIYFRRHDPGNLMQKIFGAEQRVEILFLFDPPVYKKKYNALCFFKTRVYSIWPAAPQHTRSKTL